MGADLVDILIYNFYVCTGLFRRSEPEVLHLGDVGFEGGGEGEQARVTGRRGAEGEARPWTTEGDAALRRAAELLGVEEAELKRRLTQKVTAARS